MPKRNELLKFTTSFLGTSRASAQVTIVDTSYSSTYSTKWSTNNLGTDTITETDEGKDVYLIINTVNVSNGAVVRVLIDTTGADAATGSDITNFVSTQDVTINNNFAYLKVSITADQLTENRETLRAVVMNFAGVMFSTALLYINDTSKTAPPIYSMNWYPNSTGSVPITTVNEGSTAWLIINAQNVPNGTVYSCRPNWMTGRYDFADDVLDRDVTINNGYGRVAYPIKADSLTEGDEVLEVSLYDKVGVNVLLAGPVRITIKDTSQDPETLLTITGATTATETYNNISYNVIGPINAYDYFVSVKGRAPTAADKIRFILNDGVAIVASGNTTPAVLFDSRFDGVTSLTLDNYGIILGRGGHGTSYPTEYVTSWVPAEISKDPGGPALQNTSSLFVTVNNSGVIAGGGGGGASGRGATRYGGGGGGAPYGLRGKGYDRYSPATNAGFYEPGTGAHAGDGRYAGRGGYWGEDGLAGASNNWFGVAGASTVGAFSVNNLGTGLIKGPRV